MLSYFIIISPKNKKVRQPKPTHKKRITPIAVTQTFDKLLENAETEHAFLSRNKNTSSYSLSKYSVHVARLVYHGEFKNQYF